MNPQSGRSIKKKEKRKKKENSFLEKPEIVSSSFLFSSRYFSFFGVVLYLLSLFCCFWRYIFQEILSGCFYLMSAIIGDFFRRFYYCLCFLGWIWEFFILRFSLFSLYWLQRDSAFFGGGNFSFVCKCIRLWNGLLFKLLVQEAALPALMSCPASYFLYRKARRVSGLLILRTGQIYDLWEGNREGPAPEASSEQSLSFWLTIGWIFVF